MELVTGRTEVTTGMVSFVPLLVISHSSDEDDDEDAEDEDGDEHGGGGLSEGSGIPSGPGGGRSDFLRAACILCSEGSHFRS